MRTFERTHPWISFRIDLRKAAPTLWLLLGEAASKCEHIAGVPLRPSVAQSLHQLYLAKGALATTAIEGNTLTETEVLAALAGQIEIAAIQGILGQEVDNIVAACKAIGERLRQEDATLTAQGVSAFNRQVLEKLTLAAGVLPGQVRTHSVVVGNVYRGAPAEDLLFLLGRLCDWLGSGDLPRRQAGRWCMPFSRRSWRMFIWPGFIRSVTGMAVRRDCRVPNLVKRGIPTPAAHLLSNHYNQTRAEYYRQLDRASKSGGELAPFLEYAARGFVDGIARTIACPSRTGMGCDLAQLCA